MKFDIIALNDRKFDVKRVILSDMLTDEMAANIKQIWGCDVVLHKQGKHYFVAEIEDLEWEDIPDIVADISSSGVELDA